MQLKIILRKNRDLGWQKQNIVDVQDYTTVWLISIDYYAKTYWL